MMKKLFLFLLLTVCILLIQGQQQCTDIIYLSDGDSISGCCISDVKAGNQVTYFRKSKFKSIEAIAVFKDSQYIDLKNNPIADNPEKSTEIHSPEHYKGRDHNYYQTLYKKATNQRNIGIGFTSVAAGIAIAGGIAVIADNGYLALDLLFIAAPLTAAIGVPLWISGNMKRKNNKKAMDQIERQINLSFRTTNNGIGLVLNF